MCQLANCVIRGVNQFLEQIFPQFKQKIIITEKLVLSAHLHIF